MHKVLLAVDGSEYSKQAARLLSRLPHDGAMQLVILTVVQRPFAHHNYTTSELLEESYREDQVRAEKVYEEIAALFQGANVQIQHESRDGHVGQSITEVATDSQCDLVVLGAKGHSKIHRLLLGSVSDYVSTHASCSVLVVRTEGVPPAGKPLRMVIGCDGSEPSTAGLAEIAEIPWGPSTEMHLLAVAPFLYDFYGELSPQLETTNRYESVLSVAKDQMAGSQPKLETHLIEREHVGDGIVQFADQIGCDLIAIGETSRSTLGRWLMGSVSRYVLRHATCSVWIARNRPSQVASE